MRKIISTLLLAFVVLGTQAFAQESDPREAFQSYKTIAPVSVVVPTVVSIPMEGNLYASDNFLVREKTTGALIGSLFQKKYEKTEATYSAQTTPRTENTRNLVDNDTDTFVQFDIDELQQGTVSIVLQSDVEQTASKLYTQLSPHVSLPLTVAIEAHIDGQVQTVVAQKRMTSTTVTFPETTADVWEVTFTYAQPLRISEMVLRSDSVEKTVTQDLRFLARPDSAYDVYFSSDRSVSVHTTESGYLDDDEGVRILKATPTLANPYYTPADVDGDGVRDVLDNCVRVANTDQNDIDHNGRGDACDDFDRDGRINSIDNCPDDPNANQADEDGDDIGDVCDDEESRFTEKNAWVPWVGMGVAVMVLIVLFTLVAIGTKKEEEVLTDPKEDTEPKVDGM